ncbi:MAG: HAD family phosphatase [Sedimentisphaerales bacterium]|nr:HAD family phosphatase [Sedimentisphaerales bacterium]
MGKLYGLIFDVDGVIADTEAVNAKVTARAFEKLFGLKGMRDEDFVAGIGRGDEEYVRAGARAHGMELSDEQAKAGTQLREKYFMETLANEPLPTFPGVLELIDAALASDDFRLAIATSGSFEKSRAIVKSVRAPYEKMAHISGNDVKRRKPAPDLFLLAAERLGIEPGRCVVIEDAPDGVRAAKAARAKCIAVTNTTSATNLADADLICDSLEQINPQTIRNLID